MRNFSAKMPLNELIMHIIYQIRLIKPLFMIIFVFTVELIQQTVNSMKAVPKYVMCPNMSTFKYRSLISMSTRYNTIKSQSKFSIYMHGTIISQVSFILIKEDHYFIRNTNFRNNYYFRSKTSLPIATTLKEVKPYLH